MMVEIVMMVVVLRTWDDGGDGDDGGGCVLLVLEYDDKEVINHSVVVACIYLDIQSSSVSTKHNLLCSHSSPQAWCRSCGGHE